MNDKDNKLFLESMAQTNRVHIGPFDTLEEADEYRKMMAWPSEWNIKEIVSPLQSLLTQSREKITARQQSIGTVCRCVMCMYHREK